MKRSKPRILFYSHDTYGLGHLRRTLAIARQLAGDLKDVYQLLLTGSMVAGAFTLPSRLDILKLPALSKRSSGQYKSRALPLTLKSILTWRQQMILEAAIHFKPDLLLVDKSPAGVHGELLPTLRHLKTWSPKTVLVLGMRDIEDSPEKTRAEWEAAGVPQLFDQVYDSILLYGQRNFFDPVEKYQISTAAAAKMVECGYLGRNNVTRDAAWVRRELGVGDDPLVVVTVGGGGDGYQIINTYLEMLAAWPGGPPFHTLAVTGPLMAQRKRRALHRTARNGRLTLVEFTPDLVSYLAAADLVVSMAGYNTTCEILSLGKRALFIPRVQVRAEQRMRAERLSAQGMAHMLLPDDLTPERLMAKVQASLAAPDPTVTLDMNGLPRVSEAIRNLLANNY